MDTDNMDDETLTRVIALGLAAHRDSGSDRHWSHTLDAAKAFERFLTTGETR